MKSLFIIAIMLALLFFITLIYHKEHFTNPPSRRIHAIAQVMPQQQYPVYVVNSPAAPSTPPAPPAPKPERLPPQRFEDASLRSSVIPNAPAPSGTDQTGKLMYSAVDLQANIENINNKLSNLNMNMPYMVGSEVEHQLSIAGMARMIPIPG